MSHQLIFQTNEVVGKSDMCNPSNETPSSQMNLGCVKLTTNHEKKICLCNFKFSLFSLIIS